MTEVAEEGKEVPVVAEISESVDPLPPAPEDYEEIQPEMPVMHQVADLEENLSHSQVLILHIECTSKSKYNHH